MTPKGVKLLLEKDTLLNRFVVIDSSTGGLRLLPLRVT
jgi:hypothetical protein